VLLVNCILFVLCCFLPILFFFMNSISSIISHCVCVCVCVCVMYICIGYFLMIDCVVALYVLFAFVVFLLLVLLVLAVYLVTSVQSHIFVTL
jgi:hypothetical protein